MNSPLIPTEVAAFLERRAEYNDQELGINVLDITTSIRYSEALQSMSVGMLLGLIALDDASDSNPFCLITSGAAAGMVIHLSHDPEPRIAFSQLADFQDFLRSLREQSRSIWSIEDLPAPPHPNEPLLAQTVFDLSKKELNEDTEFLLCLYLPLVTSEQPQLFAALAMSTSFLVREALAKSIMQSPRGTYLHIASSLCSDTYPQVQRPAQKAKSACRKVLYDA